MEWLLFMLIPFVALLLWSSKSGKASTWSPFQSSKVKEICEHMTYPEQTQAALLGALYGIWCAVTAIPLVLTIVWGGIPQGDGQEAYVGWALYPRIPETMGYGIAAMLLAVHLSCIRPWRRYQRRFLCNTAWAREQGLTPEDLLRRARPKVSSVSTENLGNEE